MAQLKSTNVTGNLSVTGNILASKIIKIGGTSNQILMANGETTNLSDILGKLNAAVILKGTLGTLADGGTIQALPAASATVLGHAYKVITAGTYGGITAKLGDMFICYESGTKTYAWMLIPSGDDIEDTWRPIKLEGTQILTNGTSSKPLNFKQGANVTITHSNGDLTIAAQDTTYGADRGISLVSGKFGHSNTAITAQATKGLYKFSYDAYGHITGTESYTDQNTTYSFTSGTDGFIVTPSGGAAQTVSVVTRRISSPDTRDTAIGPDGIAAGIQFDFKTGATANHPTTAGGKYVGVMTWKSYGGATDYSGGGPLQLSYDEAGVLWTRLGSRTAWGDWHQLATVEDVTSISGAYLPLAGGIMNANATITLPNSAKIVHRTNDTSNYVSDTIWYKGSKAVASGYDAQIGWHNTGDTNGAITILPYATTSEPWSSDVGLYISKTRLKYNGTNISLEGHGHTDMVTGSGLTATNIIVGNGGSKVKASGVTIDASNNLSIPGKLTVSTGAYISGRAAGSGDDEGLIIGRASNGYAGLILGGATGRRSVLYLMPDTYTALPTKAVWRYNDGTNQSEIAHPGNSGTIATQEWVTTQLGSGGSGGSGYIQGSGTANYIPKFTAANTIGDSILSADNTTVTANGSILLKQYLKINAWSGYGTGSANFWYDGNKKVVAVENVSDLRFGNDGPYATRTTDTLTENTILIGAGTSSDKYKITTSSKTITTTLGADDTTIPTSKAVADAISSGGSGSNSEYAKFLKPQDSATSDGASTWTGSAVAGTWKRGWSQRFKHTSIGSDTGDINFWLRPAAYASSGTEVCIMIDGDFYGHTGSKRVAYTDELPSVSDKQVSITTDGKGLSGAGSFTLNKNSDTTIKLTLESSASGNRAAERVVIASAKGQIDSEKYAITNDSGTIKATWQYNSSTDCVELVWA